jgi:tetratricopeptide (TPR) repeat protein
MLHRLRRVVLVALALAPFGVASAHAEVGTVVEDVELASAAGGRGRLLAADARATVLTFVRTGQERSLDALKAMAKCEQELATRPIRFVAIFSGETVPTDALAVAGLAGVHMPVLLDAGDLLYQRLGVRNHPVVFLLDARHAISSFEQYRQIDYCEVIKARLKFLLGEIDEVALKKVLEPARNTMPGDDPRDVSLRDVNLGRRQLEIKQYEKALASARKALERAPSAGAFALMGDVHAARGDCPKALKQYDQALKLDPAERHALAGRQTCAGRISHP